jgi:hypothetical protein
MKKFCQWMKENHDNEFEIYYTEFIKKPTILTHELTKTNQIAYTKQMLVQYMTEYLLLKGYISFRRYGHWLAEQMSAYLMLKDAKYGIDQPSEIIYEILKEKIEELDK